MISQEFITDISKAKAKQELAKLKQDLANLRQDNILTEDKLLITKAEAESFTDIYESSEKGK